MTNERVAQVDVKVVGLVDKAGVLHSHVVEYDTDSILITAATDTDECDGGTEIFEAEVYNLPRFCEDFGFGYYEGRLETEVILEKQ